MQENEEKSPPPQIKPPLLTPAPLPPIQQVASPKPPILPVEQTLAPVSLESQRLLDALERSLESKGYEIGVQGRNVDATKEKWAIRIGLTLAKLGLHAAGMKIPNRQKIQIVSSKMTAEKLTVALAPFSEYADLVAWSLDPMPPKNAIFVVILGDELASDEILRRYDQFLKLAPEVARLGITINREHAGIQVRVFLAYFKPAIFQEHLRSLLDKGSPWKFWRKTYAQTGFLDVQHRTLKWSKPPGITFGIPMKDPLTPVDVEQLFAGLNLPAAQE